MELLNKYNIQLRLVEETDADFIIKLRSDESKARFISKTDSDVNKQKLWIKEYKIREKNKLEFYFIAIDENNHAFATYRVYNIKEHIAEIGSFVSEPDYDIPINVIKVDLIIKSFVFSALGFDQLNFEVRKNNKSVVNYHSKFKPTLVNEDELNYYYILEKELFNVGKLKFEKLF